MVLASGAFQFSKLRMEKHCAPFVVGPEAGPAATCGNIHSKYSGLPRGPVEIVQYSSPSAPYPAGGLSTAFDDDYAC